MGSAGTFHLRVRVDGKFFRLGEEKFYVKGVSYGPFALNAQGESYPSLDQTLRDLRQLRELGANLVRVYETPPRWFLDLASAHEIKVLVDVAWDKRRCFLDSTRARRAVREAVRQAVRGCLGHPAVFGYSVANEIPSDVVRWSGAGEAVRFIEELVETAKMVDHEALFTFANYPPTEFLAPQNIDFICFNLYLHQRRSFEKYLDRLQMHAEDKPLVLGEFGIDSIREGEAQKCEMLGWQIESAFRGGLAGVVLFSFTDDWFKEGCRIEDWGMGLTTVDRKPKDSFYLVQKRFREAPRFPLSFYPRVSVVVACYNGASTLRGCLDSLTRLNYPDYEVILVDDGSTDTTAEIATLFQKVRYIRQDNHGLSVARNTGIAAATGEIVAFTDADCRVDEDWVHYLVGDLVSSRFSGIGGPNFPPPEDSAVAAAVLVSPGGPAHVMLTDRVAEHIPGCNMAFYRWVLEEIGCFDPLFRKAGDDVDICWRLQQRGFQIGFSPGGFVWHHRRSNVQAYLQQQRGYGEAEALLVRKHPEYFNLLGGSIWRGRIYASSKLGLVTRRPIIYHGVFGTGAFQAVYTGQPALSLMLCTSLEYHVLITLPLFVLSAPFPWVLPVALTSLLISVGVCVTAAVQADLPRNKRRMWSRPLVALLFFLQPVVRGLARYRGRLSVEQTPQNAHELVVEAARREWGEAQEQVYYLGDPQMHRVDFVYRIQERLDQLGWTSKSDTGWNDHDIEIFGNRWSWLRLTTVTEETVQNKRLFRCRLRTGWSLPAKIGFWSAFGAELLVIGALADDQPWLWMLLLTMPLVGVYFEQERRNLQRLVAAFLDQVARQRDMQKLQYDPEEETFLPV